MGKHRVYEIAKEFDVDSKKVMEFLSGHKVDVKSHMSSVDDNVRSMIVKEFDKKNKTTPAVHKAGAKREEKPTIIKQENKTTPKQEIKKVPKHDEQVGSKQEVKVEEKHAVAAAPTVEKVAQPTPTVKSKIIIHRPPVGGPRPAATSPSTQHRPQGQGYQPQQTHSQGTRPSTGYQSRPQGQGTGARPNTGYQSRPQGQGTGARPSTGYQSRPQGQGTGARPSTGYQSRPQGQGQRPQGQGYQSRPSGGQGYQSRPGGQGSQGYKKPAVVEKPPVDINSPHAGKEMGHRAKNFTNDKKPQGSYAQRGSRPNRNNNRMGRNNKHKSNQNNTPQPRPVVEIVRPTFIQVGASINVKAFAQLMKREVSEVIKALFLLGVMVTINQEIDHDTAVLVGSEFKVEVGELPPEEDPTEVPEVEDDPALRISRPPVVTVMGHVDHGKTSLLDAIRKANVTAREAGGITQHIGAYKVTCQGKPIVFLDTPGHEAFTSMRARGAQVTDIAILVVAADDGVMPQTLEAINHAKAAKVPIIVAINKIDKEGANIEFVKQQLSEHELIPEDWGGDTIMVPVSAHKKTGISDLLEMILLVAEVQELKANPNLPAHGTIIEAQLDKGRGPVATVLISRGTLKVGDTILAGTAYGKVRAMNNDRGERVKKALPSTPVEVLGLNDVPMAGDILDVTEERIARSVAEKRIAKKKTDEIHKAAKVSLEDIFSRIQEGELKELNIVVKADVQGTIEALKQSLVNIKNEEVKVVVVHSGVGTINETDVMLAAAANALVIGFNVRPDTNARKAADHEKVDIRTYRVIYDALNDVEAAIKGMLAPKFKEVITGHVEVRQVITISKVLIAGCYVTDGKIANSSKVRVIRDGIVIHEGDIESLRRFKDDVKEVQTGFECGLTLQNYRDLKEGDQIEVFNMEKVVVD
ncbi:MAG: translation initiation factor IF-2 [Acidaminococcaceae bacterium]|nr:translation initiation factor IF-2 [Acidaminococcaceae bacterium]